MSDHKRYCETPTGFFMVLREGDDVLAWLERLMVAESVPSAVVVGFGFASKIEFGFFDYQEQAYQPKLFENLEVTNLTGTLAWKESKPSVHAHGVAGDKTFRTFGGHILKLEVGRGSMEIDVRLMPMHLERALDASVGANVLQL